MIDLNLLRTFIAVVKHSHFGKAAEAINATQPGVSQHIARLEDYLGVRLLERTKRSVALTPAGAALYERAKHMMALARRMEDEARHIAAGGEGSLRVGMTSWVIHTAIPRRIAEFRQANPKVQMAFVVLGGDALRRMMDNDELDLMISPLPLPLAEYDSFVITRQQMGVAMPAEHPLRGQDSVTLEDLRDERFIVTPREYDPEGHDRLIGRMTELGTTIRVSAYETASLNALARVAVGEGVALVPMSFRTDQQDPVQIVPLVDARLDISTIYTARRRADCQPLALRLMDALRELQAG